MHQEEVVPGQRRLAMISIAGISYFGLVILLLSLFDSQYNPVSQAASDYGVGTFALEMNLGFFVAGISFVSFALALGNRRNPRRSRWGSALFIVAGLVLIMDSYFTTNLEGGPSTLHGLIHGFGGFIFFTTAPVASLLTSRKYGILRVLPVAAGLIVGFSLLAANSGLSGLAERIILLTIFASVIVSSVGLARITQGTHGQMPA